MAAEPILIVLVEDDDGHANLVERNLKRAGVANGIHRLKDGQEALDFVQGDRSLRRSQPEPSRCCFLLDIKMPRVDGMEVLRQLKSDPQTALIPVIMLTTTDDPREIQRCYELGCSVYITKPVDYQAFVEAINRLGLFLQVVRIPDTQSGKAVRTKRAWSRKPRQRSCSWRMTRASPGWSSFGWSGPVTPWSPPRRPRKGSSRSPGERSS